MKFPAKLSENEAARLVNAGDIPGIRHFCRELRNVVYQLYSRQLPTHAELDKLLHEIDCAEQNDIRKIERRVSENNAAILRQIEEG